MIFLSGLLPEQLTDQLNLSPSFRGKQLFKWISSGVSSFSEMKNLPKNLLNEISEKSVIKSSKITDILRDPDGTIKLQITLHDGFSIETVLLIDADNRKTACVSCQAGCPMKCAFCQTGQIGFARNLDAAEIVEEFMYMEQEAGHLDNIVFMGMGEPMLNLDAIRHAIKILTHEDGRNLSSRRITLSTSGIISGIYDLANFGPKIRLAVSLTTADPILRQSLMPVTNTNPLPDLKKAITYYTEKTGNRCTLEAALIGGVNTDDINIKKLIDFSKDIDVHINLIPWNPVPEIKFVEPTSEECNKVLAILKAHGINATLRTRRGRKIGGACGQLGKISQIKPL